MKQIVVYIQAIKDTDETDSTQSWFSIFTKKLVDAFLVRLHEKIIITEQENEFFQYLNSSKTIGMYLPLVDTKFARNSDSIVAYRNMKAKILRQYKDRAISFSLLIELFPDNHVQFQPFFKLYFPEGRKLSLINPTEIEAGQIENYFKLLMKKIELSLNKIKSSSTEGKSIYIGSSSSDLQDTSKQLYNFLLNNDISVLDPIDYSDPKLNLLVPQISEKLSSSWLSVHACSTGYLDFVKETGNDVAQSIFELELRLAAEAYKHQLQKDDEYPLKQILWIPSKPSVSTYEGRLIERLLNMYELIKNVEVLYCNFEELKQIIVSYYQTEIVADLFLSKSRQAEPEQLQIPNNIDPKSVFILYDTAYKELSQSLREQLSQKNITSYLLDDFISDANSMNNIQETILDKSKGVLLLSSNWNTNWYKYTFNEVIKSKVRRNENFEFIYTISQEIEQLPPEYEEFSGLLKMQDIIDNLERLPISNLLN